MNVAINSVARKKEETFGRGRRHGQETVPQREYSGVAIFFKPSETVVAL
jgi:hypothetical protein